jgi:hypothetical protein
MGGQDYIDATRALFTALFGEGSVKDVMVNAVYDYHYCTVDPVMADGTAYEIMFQDGLIVEATFFSSQEKSGFGTDPNWAADWIYKNNETARRSIWSGKSEDARKPYGNSRTAFLSSYI